MGICAAERRGIAILISILLLHCQTFAQPSAAFDQDIISGCSPIVVHFKDQSTGNPSQWKWDLGNGVISILQNPSTTYFNAGTYNVKLVVRNATGSDSIIKNQLITVYPNPAVDFSASDTSGCFPMTVQFTNLSTTESGSIISYSWDFGDGDTSTLNSPVHTYTTAGNFSVTLKVTNSYGCTKAFSKDKYIKVIEGVTSAFTNTIPSKCTSPVSVNFTSTSTGPASLNYTWDFGDGTSSDTANPSHTYSNAGSYTVSLITVSSLGCRDTLKKANLITIGTIMSQFNLPDSICQNNDVNFLNTTNPPPASSSWDFGDGTTSNDISPVKKYTTPGTYTIKLVNHFSGCTDSITRPVVVKPSPVPDFSADNTQSCKIPFTVQFANHTAGINNYLWDFGDGITSTDVNPVHSYTDTGSYTVKLVVFSSNGCQDTLTKPGFIEIRRPVISLNNLPQKGCVPLTIAPSSTVTVNDQVVSYSWNFGDGGTANVANPTYTYTTAGTYTVSLIIVTASGCTDTIAMPEAVRVGNKPHATFTANPTDVCAFQPIQFTDGSTGNPDQWLWQFGDGGTSTLQNPLYMFQDTGYFPVTLIVFSNTCPDTLKLENVVHIRPPIAKFAIERNCNNKLTIDFENLSIGVTSWSWNFGDGTTSTEQNPSHTYSTNGIYHVVLNVTNGICTHSSEQDIPIIDIDAAFTADTVVCKGSTVQFTQLHIDTASTAGWHWNFGDGDTSASPGITSHDYNVSGIYDVSLAIQDIFGCSDSSQLHVSVFGPAAQFSSSVPSICLRNNGPILFTDSSKTDGTHAIVKKIWNYGDGTIDSTSAPPYSHLYAGAGSYNVSLTVSDNYGCTDSISKPAAIVIADPKAIFYSPDTASCTGKPVSFVNTSTGAVLQYQWDFGDNVHSTDANPIHQYSATGNYVITLFVTDKYGCKDSASSKTRYIDISVPKARFAVSDSFTSCPPLQVKFSDSSLSYTSLKWDFGDGNRSELKDPSHYYTYPGTYFAKLIVTGPGGCMDSVSKEIDVRGPKGNFSYAPLKGCNPFTVNFNATTLDRISFTWDFSDGTTIATTDSIISHTYTAAGDFVPKMILQDASGCSVPIVGPDTIRVVDVKANFGLDQFKLCDSGRVNLHDSTISNDLITSWHWDFGNGAFATGQHPSFSYSAPGVYHIKLTVTTETGCKDSSLLNDPVTVFQGPRINILGDTAACLLSPIDVTGSVISGDSSSLSWQWSLGNGNSFQGEDPPPQTYSSPGPYLISSSVTDEHGCKDTVTKSVNIYPIPNTVAKPDTLICVGRSVTLNATGANTYLWNALPGLSCTNCDAPVVTPVDDGFYSVTGTNQYGCSSKDSAFVRVQKPIPLQVGPNDSLCLGESVRLIASGKQVYSWSPSTGLDNPNTASPRATPTVSTVYTVIARDSANCFSDSGSVSITVFPIPTVEAGPDQTIDVGSNAQLHAMGSTDIVSWNWSPSLGLNCMDCPDPNAAPKQTTKYTVQVRNEGNCVSTDFLTIYVICQQGNLFIPNAFSPNGDGMNDRFYPRGKGVFLVRSLRVFDRWGEMVFEKLNFNANDASAGWDGTFKGKLLTPDVYVYTCEIVCENNEILSYKGDVTLLR